MLKPSRMAPRASEAISGIVRRSFDEEYVAVAPPEETEALLDQQYDFMFFTGSVKTGKRVQMAAAKHLTPTALELGGKNPCIVDSNINLNVTAKRIVFGKFFNAGQNCVAPDYLLVDKRIKGSLIDAVCREIKSFYGDDASKSESYGRIVNKEHLSRLVYLLDGDIVAGGEYDAESRYLAPTLIDNVHWDAKIMEEEIFGPILPVLEYGSLDEVVYRLSKLPKPLALYFFSGNKENQEFVLNNTSSGGVCINDAIVHLQNRNLPFGGVGESGIGSYHGKATFDLFSHKKSVLKKPFFMDNVLKYPPYKMPLELLKLLMKIMG